MFAIGCPNNDNVMIMTVIVTCKTIDSRQSTNDNTARHDTQEHNCFRMGWHYLPKATCLIRPHMRLLSCRGSSPQIYATLCWSFHSGNLQCPQTSTRIAQKDDKVPARGTPQLGRRVAALDISWNSGVSRPTMTTKQETSARRRLCTWTGRSAKRPVLFGGKHTRTHTHTNIASKHWQLVR